MYYVIAFYQRIVELHLYDAMLRTFQMTLVYAMTYDTRSFDLYILKYATMLYV